MTISPRIASFICILAMTALWGPSVRADINVLIVDGFSNHSVEKTTQKIRDILASDPNFVVSVSTMPEITSGNWKDWDPDFSAYDVIIQTCNNLNKRETSWPDNVKAALESYIRGGGGMYVYHGGNNSFPEWLEYNRMIGMGWRPADYGKAVHIVDGRLEEIPAGVGKKTGHGPRLDAVVHRFGDHPIHANLPRSWKSADLEVYAYARGPLENLTVLSYAREPVNDMDFPIEWSVAYGAGRTYVSTYGHYWHNQEDPPGVRDAAFHTLMMRALQWLAKKPVTQTVPANFPTDTTISLQDAPPRVANAAVSSGLSFVYAGLVSNHIEIHSVNTRSGALQKVDTQETSDVPFFLTLHPNKKYLYAGMKGEANGIEAYSIDTQSGRLSLINKIDLEAGPVYMGIDRTGQYLFTAPWSVDQVSMSRLAEDGRLVDVKYFPTKGRPHAFAIDPSNRFLYVPCLASDVIQQYRFDARTGTVTQAETFITETESGAGPRLPIFHPSINVMYQGNEKNDTISTYKIDPASGNLNRIQVISTLPSGFEDKSNLSELHLTPNGTFLYIANRGHNSIAGYRVSPKDGTLTLLELQPVPGKTIRSFSISPTGEFLYAADQKGGDLVTFSIDHSTGGLTQTHTVNAKSGIGIVKTF